MLKKSKNYKIIRIDKGTCSHYRHKLLSMGLLPGATFEVIRYAPLGDTIQIQINDFSLSLRSKEMACLALEEVSL